MAKKRRVPRVATLKSKPLVSEAEVAQARAAKEQAAAEAVKKVDDVVREPSATVCLSRIPHGFYEKQMKGYFSQFGNVKRMRLSRSKKSGRSKGYAFIEFEFPEVAKIAAETMDGYLTYQKIMKCRVMDKEKIHENLWKGADQPFRKPWHRKASKERHNSLLNANPDRIHNAQKRRVQMERRKNKKLEALGIDYKIDTLQSEWTNLKGPVTGPKTPKNNKWLKAKGEKKKRNKRRMDDEGSPPSKKAKAVGVDEDDKDAADDDDVGDSFAKMVMEAFKNDEDGEEDEASSGDDSDDDLDDSDEQSGGDEPSEDYIQLPDDDQSDSEVDSDEEDISESDNEQSNDGEETKRTGTKKIMSSMKQKLSTPKQEQKPVLPTPKKGKGGATPKSSKKVQNTLSSPKASVKETVQMKSSPAQNLRKTPGKTPAQKLSKTPGKTPAQKLSKTPGKTPKGVKENSSSKVSPDLKQGKDQKKTPAKTPKRELRNDSKTNTKTPGKTPKSEMKDGNSKKTPGRVTRSVDAEPIVKKTPGKTPGKGVVPAKKGSKTPKGGWKVSTPKSSRK